MESRNVLGHSLDERDGNTMAMTISLTFTDDQTMILLQDGQEVRLTLPQQRVVWNALRIKFKQIGGINVGK